jgi:hypothetical protein
MNLDAWINSWINAKQHVNKELTSISVGAEINFHRTFPIRARE